MSSLLTALLCFATRLKSRATQIASVALMCESCREERIMAVVVRRIDR